MKINNATPTKTLEARAHQMCKEIARAVPAHGYVTYVIRAPIQSGELIGRPFYVGQTINLAKRARTHLLLAARRFKPNKPVHRQIYEIYLLDQLPTFDVLEVKDSLLASLQSETNWVKYFQSQKFELANAWSEHKASGKVTRGVPQKRLLQFTLSQANVSKLRLMLRCRQCDIAKEISLPLDTPEIRGLQLSDLKQNIRCPNCGKAGCLWIQQP